MCVSSSFGNTIHWSIQIEFTVSCRHINNLHNLSSQPSYLLSDLNHSFPEVLGFDAVTVVAHLVLDHKLHDKHLLQDGAVQHLQGHRYQESAMTSINSSIKSESQRLTKGQRDDSVSQHMTNMFVSHRRLCPFHGLYFFSPFVKMPLPHTSHFLTSFWMVTFILILLEWGSVHRKPASMRRT